MVGCNGWWLQAGFIFLDAQTRPYRNFESQNGAFTPQLWQFKWRKWWFTIGIIHYLRYMSHSLHKPMCWIWWTWLEGVSVGPSASGRDLWASPSSMVLRQHGYNIYTTHSGCGATGTSSDPLGFDYQFDRNS
jgi:hypothetical protein